MRKIGAVILVAGWFVSSAIGLIVFWALFDIVLRSSDFVPGPLFSVALWVARIGFGFLILLSFWTANFQYGIAFPIVKKEPERKPGEHYNEVYFDEE
jgi:hypothetical protein